MRLPADHLVALTACAVVRNDGTKDEVSGLFELVEHLPYEPSNYVHEAGWVICPAAFSGTENWDEQALFVTEYDLREQIDPKAHASFLQWERFMEFAFEDGDLEEMER